MIGIILAGGKSERFGYNKALAKINNETFLERMFDLVDEVTDNPCIILSRYTPYEVVKLSRKLTKCIIFDLKLDCEGPLRGIVTADYLIDRGDNYLLYTAVDLPYLKSNTLKKFIEIVLKHKPLAATTLLSDNTLVTSIGILSKKSSNIIRKICRIKSDKSRLSDLYRLHDVLLVGWSLLSGNYKEFININKPNIKVPKFTRKNNIIKLNHYNFEKALEYWNSDPATALSNLEKELEYYRSHNLKYLEKIVIKDINILKNNI